MGLGKTLMALATISASKNSAAAFANAEPGRESRITRATLVVVPFESLNPFIFWDTGSVADHCLKCFSILGRARSLGIVP